MKNENIHISVCIYILLDPNLSSFLVFKDHLDTNEVFHFSSWHEDF